jgi:hypothetical protein
LHRQTTQRHAALTQICKVFSLRTPNHYLEARGARCTPWSVAYKARRSETLKPQVVLLYGTERPGCRSTYAPPAQVEDLVRQTSTSFLGLISRALRATYDKVVEEPLPERWVDLINHLNDCEKAGETRDQLKLPLPTQRQVH